MSGPHEPYEIEGDNAGKPAEEPTPPAAPGASDKPRLFNIPLPPPTAEPAKGKIEASKLLEGFEEDADFDKDPELERAITGKSGKPDEAPKPEEKEDLIKPGLGNSKVWAIVGSALLVGALIATGTSAPGPRFASMMLMLYDTLLHTGTGVVALYCAAALLSKRVGSLELAAARMFAAVSAFSLMFSLHMSVLNVEWLDKTLGLLVASAVYVLLVCSTFGLWKRTPLAYVVGSHFMLWIIVQVGMMLSAFVVANTPIEKSAAPIPVRAPAERPASSASPTPQPR